MLSKIDCYFAYGSNMNPARMKERGVSTTSIERAELRDFELKFNKRSRKSPQSGRANIVAKAGSTVHGLLYRLASPREILRLDPYEYAPVDYRRLVAEVQSARKPVLSWTYIARDRVVDDELLPPRWYVEHLLAGCPYLPQHYVKALRNVVCSE